MKAGMLVLTAAMLARMASCTTWPTAVFTLAWGSASRLPLQLKRDIVVKFLQVTLFALVASLALSVPAQTASDMQIPAQKI